MLFVDCAQNLLNKRITEIAALRLHAFHEWSDGWDDTLLFGPYQYCQSTHRYKPVADGNASRFTFVNQYDTGSQPLRQ